MFRPIFHVEKHLKKSCLSKKVKTWIIIIHRIMKFNHATTVFFREQQNILRAFLKRNYFLLFAFFKNSTIISFLSLKHCSMFLGGSQYVQWGRNEIFLGEKTQIFAKNLSTSQKFRGVTSLRYRFSPVPPSLKITV